MLRSTLIAAGAAVLCGAGFAQQTLDASKVYPITSPVKDAGVINVNTRRWMSPSQIDARQNAVGVQAIYDNRCTWAGGGYYTGTGSCEDYIDEGEVPGSDNLVFVNQEGGIGASATNNVVAVQIGYCTNFAVPALTIGFYDSLGGQCGGLASSSGGVQGSLASQACPAGLAPTGINPSGTAYYDVGATGLPGDATPGGAAVSCWLVGVFLGNSGFCMKSEGDGVWDNDADLDRFNWSWQMNNPLVAGTAASGIILSGEPASLPNPIVFGACTYNLPCDADALTGATCGTGRAADDGFWINIDGDKAGDSTNTGVACVSAPGDGGCYWFGGYPGNPFGSFWMLMIANGGCDNVAPQIDAGCVGQPLPSSTNGCNSVATAVGLPSASSNQPFNISYTGLNGNVNGVVTYGISGLVNIPWSSISNLCIKSPVQRMNGVAGAAGSTGGASGTCGGSYSFEFNGVLQGTTVNPNNGNPYLGAPMSVGQVVHMQAWLRDSANPKTSMQAQHLSFAVGI